MSKIKIALFAATLLSVSAMCSSIKPQPIQAQAEPNDGLSLVAVGAGVKALTNDGQGGWDINGGVPFTRISEGVYTTVFYTTGGGFTVLEEGKG